MNVSKELLSEVLNCYIHSSDYRDVLCYKNTIRYWLTPNSQSMPNVINIYELAFRTREHLKTKSKHLSLNQSIDDIFKEANDIYESLSK